MIKALRNIGRTIKSALSDTREYFVSVQSLNALLGFGNKEQATISDTMRYGYTNPFFFTILNDLANRCKKIPTHFVDSKGNEVKSPIADMEKPNPYESWGSFFYKVYSNMLIGEVFIFTEQIDSSFTFTEIYCPNINDVTINYNAERGIYRTAQSYSVTGRGKVYDKDLVLHIKTPNLAVDDCRGFGALRAAYYGWDISNNVLGTKQGAYRGVGANKLLTVKGDRPADPKRLEVAQEALDNVSQGKDKAGRSVLIGTELTAIDIGFKPKDYEFSTLQDNDVQFAAMMFGVAPQLYGYSKSSTYNNMSEMKLDRLTGVVLSLVEAFLEELTTWLVQGNRKANDVFWKYDKSSIPELNSPNLEYMAHAKDIIKSYNKNEYTFFQAFKMLMQLDYSEEEVEEMLQSKPEQEQDEIEVS